MDTMNNYNRDSQYEIDSEPIYDIACEKMVLSTLIISYSAVVDTDEILDESCFRDLKHQQIFSAIRYVFRNGDTPDMISVSARLASTGSSVSSLEIAELCVNSCSTLEIIPRAYRLKELAIRRKIRKIGQKLVSISSNEISPIDEIQNLAKSEIDSMFEDSATQFETLSDTYKQLQEQMLLNHDMPEGAILGTPTGFPALDNNGGLLPSDLVIVGAETSQGKTSFATALALSAIKHGDGVAFYSMEMMPIQLASRIASMQSRIPSSKILSKKMDIDEIYKIDRSMENIDMSKMYFDGRSSSSLDSILMSIRSMKLKYNIKGAVVDYLQLVNIKTEKLNREQSVAKCARDLKNLAKELGIWIIAISQLSRDPRSPIPNKSRLRDSGQIEEAADNIILIYRPDKNNKYPEPYANVQTRGTALVMVDKGRNTGTTDFICGFDPHNTLFYPLYPEEIERMKTGFYTPSTPEDQLEENIPF